PGRADDAGDVAYFSSKGSAAPGARIKPDVVAPGSFVYANAFPNYFGCETERIEESEFPRVYARSFGTSFSAPIVSGMAQVVTPYLKHEYGLANPSPAMLKAYVIHT